MHDYLLRCLDSICIESVLGDVQVIVVDDGSTDDTSQIAHEYADRYPHYFQVIDKENGNYGSCMNVALPLAEGKYFRTLDADDWYDTEAYYQYVRALAHTDSDLITSPRIDVRFVHDKVQSQFIVRDDIFHVMNVCYRTHILYESGMQWSEGVYYTDHEFLFLPLPDVQNISCLDFPVYCYAIGREGQSVSWTNTMKNLGSRVVVTERLLNRYLQIFPTAEFLHPFYIDVLMRLLTNVYATLYTDGLKHEDSVKKIERLVLQNPELKDLTDQLNDFHFYRGGYYVRAYRRNRLSAWFYFLHYHIKMNVFVRRVVDFLKRSNDT